MKSIMHRKDGTCYLCMVLHSDHSLKQTQEHHALHGAGRRRLSEKYGLKVYLCLPHHTADGGPEAVHRNAETDLLVKRQAQRAFEKRWPELDFRGIFGKNYLDDSGKWQQAPEEGEQEPGFRFIKEEEDYVYTGKM